MPADRLKLVRVQVAPPSAEERAAGPGQARLSVAVDVENQTGDLLYVWASDRGYSYDAASKVLTLHLSEQPLVLPPNIIMISDHPRVPAQVEVAPNSRSTVNVTIPAVVRRPAPGGVGWVEDPIGEVARVDVDVQFDTSPIEAVRPHESSGEFRSRLMQRGEVVQAQLAPSARGGPRRR